MSSRTARLVVVLALNLGLVAVLIVVGVTAHSLGVIAEGGDYLLDAAGIAAVLGATAWSRRQRNTGRPRGRSNAIGVAALVNAAWLLLLEALVAVGSVARLVTGAPEVHGLPVLVVSGVAAVVMAAGALLLRGTGEGDDEGEDLGRTAVLLDTAADAAAAAGVAVVGAVILATGGWFWLDPAVALAVAVVVGYHALALVRRVVNQLALSKRRA